MKKILSLCFFLFVGTSLTYAQTTYEVGEGQTYPRISEVWEVIKASEETDFIINVGEGTYVENELPGIANKKITIIGAGADKTIVMRSDVEDFPFLEEYGEGPTDGRVACGYLFRSQAKDMAENYHLVCENMTFKNIGINRHNWGGALVVAEGNNQTYEFRNCMFTKINARQGALVGATPAGGTTSATEPIKVVFEDCFVDACYVHNFNNISGLFTFKFGGDLTLKNTTFMNTRVNLTNLNGPLEYPNVGLIVSMPVPASSSAYASNLTIENVNILNTDIIGGTPTNLTSMIKIMVEEGVALPPTCTIQNLVSLNNYRTEGVDCDLYFSAANLTPTITSSVLNGVKNTADNSDMETLTGATIDKTLTYDSEEVRFEMDGSLPKIFVNAKGVKYLKFADPNSIVEENADHAPITIEGNLLRISDLKQNEAVSIYDITGKLIYTKGAETTSVEITLSQGVYILKIGNYATKIKI